VLPAAAVEPSFQGLGDLEGGARPQLRRFRLKPSYHVLAGDVIRVHLEPYFGGRDVRTLTTEDLLGYVRAKLDAGLAPATIRVQLSVLRRVLSLLERDGKIAKNAARGIGGLLRQVGRAIASETDEVEHWSRSEVQTLLGLARQYESRFAPFLALLFATGLRRGEALGLHWSDVNFDSRVLSVRRAITKEGVTTPKSGRARRVPMTPASAETLFDLLAERRREALARGWRETPEWVFCPRRALPSSPGMSSASGTASAAVRGSRACAP
jgi:integrase